MLVELSAPEKRALLRIVRSHQGDLRRYLQNVDVSMRGATGQRAADWQKHRDRLAAAIETARGLADKLQPRPRSQTLRRGGL